MLRSSRDSRNEERAWLETKRLRRLVALRATSPWFACLLIAEPRRLLAPASPGEARFLSLSPVSLAASVPVHPRLRRLSIHRVLASLSPKLITGQKFNLLFPWIIRFSRRSSLFPSCLTPTRSSRLSFLASAPSSRPR